MEIFHKISDVLLGKRRATEDESGGIHENQEQGGKRKRPRLETNENGIAAFLKNKFWNILFWFLPQFKTVPSPSIRNMSSNSDNEVVVLEEIEQKGKPYDPLKYFDGFSPTSKTIDTNWNARDKRKVIEQKIKKRKKTRKLSNNSLQTRDLYKKILDKISALNAHFSNNYFEDYIKKNARKTSKKLFSSGSEDFSEAKETKSPKKLAPLVIDANDASEKEDALENMAQLKTELDLVTLDDNTTSLEVIEIYDDSDTEDEDERYYENRQFVKKECNILCVSSDDDDEKDSVEDRKIDSSTLVKKLSPKLTESMLEFIAKAGECDLVVEAHSMGEDGTSSLNIINTYLHEEYRSKKGEFLEEVFKQRSMLKSVPQQENGVDCGVFTCLYADHISRGAELDFSQSDIPYYRKRMIWEIAKNCLMEN